MFISMWTLVLALAGGAAATMPLVVTSSGVLHGGTCNNIHGANYFKGIPYAQPPVGALRFGPPQAYHQRYPGGRWDATQPAPSCIQFGSEFTEPASQSAEDCLYLDIWTPAHARECKGLPVRVWLYGGANQAGGISDPMYDGCNVASTDAIMVSINYRMGPLGFLSLKHAGFGGNQGIQDILLGLQWVQDNIAAFGGDPKKVLLHGQSAGAFDAFSIATLPQAPRLFSAAIFESGGGRFLTHQSAVETISAQYAEALNCGNVTRERSCLQETSIAELHTAYNDLPLLNTYTLPPLAVANESTPAFVPCVDGKVIPKQPNRQPARVPSVFGSNALEGTLFTLASFAKIGAAAATAAVYQKYLQQNFGPDASTIAAHYPLAAFHASANPVFSALATVFTHAEFLCPTRRGAERTAAAGIPSWVYLFAQEPTCPWIEGIPAEDLPILGPTHTAEIPFVFGHTQHLPLPNGTCSMTAQEVQISHFMRSAWTTMAATQRPGSEAEWPAWSKAQHGININGTVAPGYVNYTVCELWDTLDARR